ncbi:MAG: TolC family protein [Saprospiraceae bacterium]|nr:TolC family protein [Saprospiraceae bacterium]
MLVRTSLITCLLSISISTFGQEPLSLEQSIRYARENHNSVKDALLEIEDAKGNIKEFLSIGMPKVTGNVDLQHFIDIPTSIIPQGSFFAGDTDLSIPPNPAEDLEVQFGFKNNITASLDAEFLLFDGSFLVGLRAARLFKGVVEDQSAIAKEEVGENVAKSYLSVLVAQKNQEILEKNISNLQGILRETEVTYENGFVEKLDVDRLHLSLANLQIESERIESLVEISMNVLKFSMGYPMTEELRLSETFDDHLISEYEQETYAAAVPDYHGRAQFVAVENAQKLNEINILRHKVGYVPTLRGFGTYSQILQGNKFLQGIWFPTSLVGLTLSVPIYDGSEKSAKIQRARIARDQHALTIENVRRAIELEVSNAQLSFQNARKSVQSTTDNLSLAERIYETTQIKYREGVGSSLEVSRAESDLYQSQSNYINALYDLLVAKVDMEKALGTL